MTETHKLAAIQLASGTNVSANLLEIEKLTEQAVSEGAKLVVLPENFAYMGKSCSEIRAIAETEGNGPLQDFLSHLASRFGIWVVGGTIPLETTDASRFRSACLVFDDKGERKARYDKMHLFDVNLPETDESYTESKTIEPGSDIVVIDTPFGHMGIAVCYDLRFPELFRAMLDKKAEVFVLPAAFTAITGKAHWEVMLRARASENLAYVVAAAQGGFHINSRETYGHSMIIDPWGSVLANLDRGNGVITASISNEFQQTTRRNFPCLDHRKLSCR